MTSQSSGGSGSGLPGITGDGHTPGGLTVAGTLTAGDPNAATVPSEHSLYGNISIYDVPGNNVDGDDPLIVTQSAPLSADANLRAMSVYRNGTLNGHDYLRPMLEFEDNTASAQPLMVVSKVSVTQFQVDSDGVQVHGKLKTGASVTHTAAVLSGKCVPIYDEAGTLLGYMPLYN